LNGVVNIDMLDITRTMPSTVNAQAMIESGKKLLKKYPEIEKMIYWIVDNAKYHRAKIFKECLQTHSQIKILFLPSYSPNLNLMERLGKFFYEKVRCNGYCEKFSDFVQKAKDFFRWRTKFKKELRTRSAENFQTFGQSSMALGIVSGQRHEVWNEAYQRWSGECAVCFVYDNVQCHPVEQDIQGVF